jgi:integrase/recombinase XerD
MVEEGYSAIPEKKLQQIKRPPQDAVTKTAEDLITADEIERMVTACTWTRDRALLLTLYEGGMRIGEIGTLTWGDVKFDEKGVVITVKSQKTEKARYLRLVMAREHLARWKADYPGEARADAPVFISTRREPLAYSTLTKQIQRIAKRAGMEKRITPHLFRHSRITDLVREGLPESTIKMMMWNNQGTDMLNRYTHLTGGDIDTQILEASGIRIRPEDARPVLKPLQCSRCYAICAPTSRFCCECGNPLTEEAAKDLGETVHRLDEIIPALSTGQLDEIADRVAEKLSRLERRNPRPPSTMGDQK